MSYKRQLFTGVNNVVNTATNASSSSSSSSPPAKDLPEFNIAILGVLGVGKSGTPIANMSAGLTLTSFLFYFPLFSRTRKCFSECGTPKFVAVLSAEQPETPKSDPEPNIDIMNGTGP